MIMGDSCSMPEGKSSINRCDGDSCSEDQISVDELSASLDKQKFNSSDVMNYTSNVQRRKQSEEHYVEDNEEEEDEEEDDLSEEELLEQMGYVADKSYTIEDHQKQSYYDEGDELSEELILHEPNNLPMANLNLVSALKGSREKEGKPTEGCRVSWAPDVYDPPHTPPEEFFTNNIETQKSERNSWGGKNKQKKGKGGGKGKGKKSKDDRQVEKKHGKKRGGSSSRRRGFDA